MPSSCRRIYRRAVRNRDTVSLPDRAMDGFLNKLDNLAYELFGIVLPGLVASVFLILLWIGLGSLPPVWSSGQVPTLTPDTVRRLIDRIPGALQTVTVICTLMVWYFLGHGVNWISKGRSHTRGEFKERVRRIWSFLKFRIQKPADSFDPALRKLFEAVSREFSGNKEMLQWREFYPLAKNHLANTGRNSLLATYQNKYTLHRSIAAAAAASFWISIVSICAARISKWFGLGGAHRTGYSSGASQLLRWSWLLVFLQHSHSIGRFGVTR